MSERDQNRTAGRYYTAEYREGWSDGESFVLDNLAEYGLCRHGLLRRAWHRLIGGQDVCWRGSHLMWTRSGYTACRKHTPEES